MSPIPPSMRTVVSTLRPSTPSCWTCVCPVPGGLDALRRIKERRPEAVVIVVTGLRHGAVGRAGHEEWRL